MKKPDSIISAEERSKAIRAEAALREKEMAEAEEKRKELAAMRDEELRQVEEVNIRQLASIAGIETRDHLLDHIRRMREEVPKEPTPPPAPIEPKVLTAEEKLGREMVARAEAQQQRAREMRRRIEEEERARAGSMSPVFQANPSQDQKFPVLKATIK